MDEATFLIVVLSILSATLICCLPIVLVFWAVARKRKHRAEDSNDEARLRRIWDGLQRMEDRLDNIETIVGKPRRREHASSGKRGNPDEY